MGLLLTGTQDQALLAFVISEARKVADQHHSYLGRTAVQKIMYFLKNAGVPMRYRFSIYHFGPFSDEILNDSDFLIADSVIADRSSAGTKYYDYTTGEAFDELVSRYREMIEPWRDTIANVIRNLAPFDALRMEAIATLDYIYREQLATRDGHPTRESVVARFMELKGDKFQRQDIEQLYDAMHDTKALN